MENEPFIEEYIETDAGFANELWLDNGDGTRKLVSRKAVTMGGIKLVDSDGNVIFEGGTLTLFPPDGLQEFTIVDVGKDSTEE